MRELTMLFASTLKFIKQVNSKFECQIKSNSKIGHKLNMSLTLLVLL